MHELLANSRNSRNSRCVLGRAPATYLASAILPRCPRQCKETATDAAAAAASFIKREDATRDDPELGRFLHFLSPSLCSRFLLPRRRLISSFLLRRIKSKRLHFLLRRKERDECFCPEWKKHEVRVRKWSEFCLRGVKRRNVQKQALLAPRRVGQGSSYVSLAWPHLSRLSRGRL